jgi:hypothetical protein
LLLCGLTMFVARIPAAVVTPFKVAGANRFIGDAPQEQSSKCDSNCSGCVPVASDVDCAGGSGNGPAYVQGPIRVIGSDIYVSPQPFPL